MSLKLREYQQQAIADVEARRLAGDTRVPIVLATGLGKGHPLDTEVPTPDGWRRWGDLKEGDRLFDRNGDPTFVTAVFDRGELPTYRVTFSDESSVVVDGDHLWAVRDSGQSYRPWVTASTAELARHEMKRKRGWRFHIPMANAARFDADLSLPLDPYTAGALISNGGMTSKYHTMLTTPDVAVVERVRAAGHLCVKINDADPKVCDRYRLPYATVVTEMLGMRVKSAEKRIPPRYLAANVSERIALLNGLMDGDGSKRDDTRRSVGYFTSSPGLASDVRELVNSLGGTGIVKRYDRGAKGVEYAVRILLPSGVQPFSTMRKSGNGSRGVRDLQPKRAIVSIESAGVQPIRCITVSAPDHLYLIGRGYHVTHNTQIFTAYIDQWLTRHPGRRALVIVHTDELVMQAVKRARDVCPTRRIGIVKAGQNETSAEIIVASRQTLASARRREQLRHVGLIVIDECHHCHRANTYGKILDHFGAFDEQPGVFVLGVTATLARSDKAKLSSVWQECTFTRDILFGIRHGYLLDVRGERIIVPDMDLSGVRIRAGDYADVDLAEELERTFAPEVIAREYLRAAAIKPDEADWVPEEDHPVRRGIAFWPLVDTAHHGAKAFEEVGIRSGVVSGQTERRDRLELLRRFSLPLAHSEAIDVMHNAMVLTEGFDEPTADVVVIARPTRSAPLYQQMVGRVLRPDLTLAPELREKALILDVTGAGAKNNLRSLIDLSPERPVGTPEPEEGQSLLEWDDVLQEIEEDLDDKRAGATFEFDAEDYAGQTETKEFDPLGRSTVWGKTPDGNLYINTGDAYVFLTPALVGDPGTWDVVKCETQHTGWVRGTEHVALSLEMALNWGEDVAYEVGGYGTKSLTGRKSAWRRGEPSEKQKAFARQLRIEGADTMNKGELSEAIDAVQAARRIDPLVKLVRSRVNSSGS